MGRMHDELFGSKPSTKDNLGEKPYGRRSKAKRCFLTAALCASSLFLFVSKYERKPNYKQITKFPKGKSVLLS